MRRKQPDFWILKQLARVLTRKPKPTEYGALSQIPQSVLTALVNSLDCLRIDKAIEYSYRGTRYRRPERKSLRLSLPQRMKPDARGFWVVPVDKPKPRGKSRPKKAFVALSPAQVARIFRRPSA